MSASPKVIAMEITRTVKVELTERDMAILQALADGLTDKEIAVKLGVCVRNAKLRIHFLRAKIGEVGCGRSKLVAFAFRKGLIG